MTALRNSNIPMRRYLSGILFLLCFNSGAQDYPYDIAKYEVINYEENILKFYGDSQSFTPFFKHLTTLISKGDRQIHIVHFGGSHIQADVFSGRVRQRIQAIMPGLNGGRGLIFPYNIANSNNPANYRFRHTGEWEYCKNTQRKRHCPLGLSGYSVTTYDSTASFKWIQQKDYIHYEFNRIKVFCAMDSNNTDIEILNPHVSYHKVKHFENGYTEFILESYIDSVEFVIKRNHPHQTSFTLYGMLPETNDPGIVYHGIGVNGASVPSYLRCTMLEDHLEVISPDLIIFSIGINDAYSRRFDPEYFEQNHDSLIARIRNIAPNVPIIFTVNNDSYLYRRYTNKNVLKVRERMLSLAGKYDAAVWDLFEVMGGLNSILSWQRLNLAKRDKIHFTKEGYILIGDLFYNALIKSLDKYIENTIQHEKLGVWEP